KYNMTDIAAAMGLAQLRRTQSMYDRRHAVARRYDDGLADVPEVERPHRGAQNQHSWHLYMLRLHLDRLRIDRDTFIDELKRRNVGASVHFFPLHVHPYYRDTYGYRPEDFPVAWREFQREVSLPIFSRMTDADADDVVAAIRDIVAHNRA